MTTPRAILDRLAALGIHPTGVADDSRQVQPGDAFLAYPGDLADGRRYIGDAIARGAVAVLWQAGGDFAWNPALTAANFRSTACARWPARWRMPCTANRALPCR